MVSIWLTISPPKIARPSGRRSSAPSPQPSISGTAANNAASVVIRIGRKRSSAAWWIASRADFPSWRCASIAKSIIMIAFFLTMPINRMMPMMPTTPRLCPVIIRASSAPTPAEGSVDRMVSGWM
jgi:hypothetical protein